MLCVLILYISGRTYSLKSIPNNKFLRNRNLLKESRQRNIFLISFCLRCLSWGVNRSLTLPTRLLVACVHAAHFNIVRSELLITVQPWGFSKKYNPNAAAKPRWLTNSKFFCIQCLFRYHFWILRVPYTKISLFDMTTRSKLCSKNQNRNLVALTLY